MTPFESELVATLPNLRKFATRLTRNPDRADDLVQATALRALEKFHLFEMGTNMFSWTSKIMYNTFISGYRRMAKFESQYDPEPYTMSLLEPRNQEDALYCKEIRALLSDLPRGMVEAVDAVSEGGSYEEAAEELGVPIGTVRSRLSRARALLEASMDRAKLREDA